MSFQGVDYYDIDGLLSDEEKMTRNVVREFLEKEIEPLIVNALDTPKTEIVRYITNGRLLKLFYP